MERPFTRLDDYRRGRGTAAIAEVEGSVYQAHSLSKAIARSRSPAPVLPGTRDPRIASHPMLDKNSTLCDSFLRCGRPFESLATTGSSARHHPKSTPHQVQEVE
jgi:hypothetical protein